MPGPDLSFWRFLVCLALTQKKMARERVPTWGWGQRKDLGCLPVLSAFISWDERTSASCAAGRFRTGSWDRGFSSLAAGGENSHRKENHGCRKSKLFPSVVAED